MTFYKLTEGIRKPECRETRGEIKRYKSLELFFEVYPQFITSLVITLEDHPELGDKLRKSNPQFFWFAIFKMVLNAYTIVVKFRNYISKGKLLPVWSINMFPVN